MSKIICIVDDEEELIHNLKIEIQDLRPEWTLRTFSDGLKALQEIMNGSVNLVLTDIAMPDMDGYELFWRVKDYDANIPVIMMTGFGYDPNHVLLRSKMDGLKDVIFKPFDVEKLVALIDRKLKNSDSQ
ncbi:MAG: response regulator [Candidatus Cloacimonadaceae bacterium]|jgi:DNA-binding NtrC family response regulator|nr:response regulator [Candidatus Cloacimonadota bacterium]MDY0128343.1 response regulator [Candidatus Cloacimonadaceae bacterium]MCB5255055.1 response regulator [Candidatus Cloacimonadota bacterium]MCK9178921.1 response regulator [Candidatus Cloacimonadota bacterium]MCK9243316.1 response regulator [Candidatus Cloacimonadota bacterium]